MCQLMSDYDSNPAIIDSIGSAIGIERRLQNSRREINVVLRGAVISIYGRRSHAPFRAIYGLADLIDVSLAFKFVGTVPVAEVVVIDNLYRRIISPLIRISNLVRNGMQLDERLLLCFRAHPSNGLNVVSHLVFDFAHHIERPLLPFLAERFFDKLSA